MTAPDPKRAFWDAYTAEHPDPFQFTVYDRLRPETLAALEAGTKAAIGDYAKILADVTGQGDDLRELVAEILSHFGPSGSGHTARVGQVQIAKWSKRAGLEDQ